MFVLLKIKDCFMLVITTVDHQKLMIEEIHKCPVELYFVLKFLSKE